MSIPRPDRRARKRRPGRPVELPDGQRVIFRLPGEQLERLDAAAAEHNVTRSDAIRAAIEEWLARGDRERR